MAQDQAQPLSGIIRDTEIESYLKRETRPLLQASAIDADRVHFILVADSELNASASTQLNIALNTGLIEAADTPNQLMGVIAHEAGHLSAGHLVRSDEVFQEARLPTAVALGLGIIGLLASGHDPEAGFASANVLASSTTFGTLGALHYLQTQEAAADIAGVKSLERAGISGKGLVDFFDKFRQSETFSDAERYKYFRTHPLSRDRIQTLRKLVSGQPHFAVTDTEASKVQFGIIKAKLAGFLDSYQGVMLKYPATDTSFAARYARAIATYKITEVPSALDQVDALIRDYPDNPYLWELKGQIFFETGRAKLAKPCHEKSVALMPDAPLLHLNLGQSLLSTGDKADLKAASVELQKSLEYEDDNAFSWALLAQVYDGLGQAGAARLASAEAAYFEGDLETARTFAVWSQKNLDPKSPDYRRARDIVLATSSQMGIDPVDGESHGHGKDKKPH